VKTSIEWTSYRAPDGRLVEGYTFNPWWGCTEVPKSPACENCYAREFSERFPRSRGLWGHDARRLLASEKTWGAPSAWNDEARRDGLPRLVFCASMGDVFEARQDLDEPRARLFQLIAETPWLRWLLLTKRPHHAARLVPATWRDRWPSNVWAGATVEDSEVRWRVDALRRLPAAVRFVSAEPIVVGLQVCGLCRDGLARSGAGDAQRHPIGGGVLPCQWAGIDWLIIGGESGPRARPLDVPEAARLVEEARAGGASVFWKQYGEAWARLRARELGRKVDVHGRDPADWPEVMPREMPRAFVGVLEGPQP